MRKLRAPALLAIPDNQEAVSNAVVFTLTLSDTLTDDQLVAIAEGAVVEFGSDYQYLSVPAPGSLALLCVGIFGARRRRV